MFCEELFPALQLLAKGGDESSCTVQQRIVGGSIVAACFLDKLVELPSVTDRCRAFSVLGNSPPVDVPVMSYRPGHLTSEVPVLRTSLDTSALHPVHQLKSWAGDPVPSYASSCTEMLSGGF